MRWLKLSLLIPALLAGAFLAHATGETTKLTIQVKTQGGHPIDQAEVIVRWHANEKHPREGFGKAVRTTFEMRSNQEGEADVPEIPRGNILIQINAKGYQTFGKVFSVEEPEKTIEIRLNPPQQQYTAH